MLVEGLYNCQRHGTDAGPVARIWPDRRSSTLSKIDNNGGHETLYTFIKARNPSRLLHKPFSRFRWLDGKKVGIFNVVLIV